jgi:hypothetical protein
LDRILDKIESGGRPGLKDDEKGMKTAGQVFALSKGEGDARIPSGRLLRGQVSYNKPWHWHIDSQDIAIVEVAIELCDGRPSDVENNQDYWIDIVGRFCPWSAQLVALNDYR